MGSFTNKAGTNRVTGLFFWALRSGRRANGREGGTGEVRWFQVRASCRWSKGVQYPQGFSSDRMSKQQLVELVDSCEWADSNGAMQLQNLCVTGVAWWSILALLGLAHGLQQ